MFWMFAALILAAITTAQLAAGLTSSISNSTIESVGDLAGLDVGTVAGSAASFELDVLHVTATDYPGVTAGLDALDKGRSMPLSMTARHCSGGFATIPGSTSPGFRSRSRITA
nr:hypothetical protein [Marinicella sp. W31]MDC2878164.1 hypothetical protein [Marinicella sp. W31]